MISNEIEYQEFIYIAYRCGVQLHVYMEHFGTNLQVSKENEIDDNCSVRSSMSMEMEDGVDLTESFTPMKSNIKGVTYDGVIQENGNGDVT